MAKKNRKIRETHNPKKSKEVRPSKKTSTQEKKLVWEVTKIDKDGKWGWNNLSCAKFLKLLWKKMRNFETMTWSEILGSKHHMISVKDIIKPAQDRLRELDHDDQDELVSFRVSGSERIWAIRSEESSFILWWDPNHEIYPSSKKYT